MNKTFEGKIVSLKMDKTAVVEVIRYRQHRLYKKLLKRSKSFMADLAGKEVKLGDRVRICAARSVSKNKHFKIMEVIK